MAMTASAGGRALEVLVWLAERDPGRCRVRSARGTYLCHPELNQAPRGHSTERGVHEGATDFLAWSARPSGGRTVFSRTAQAPSPFRAYYGDGGSKGAAPHGGRR